MMIQFLDILPRPREWQQTTPENQEKTDQPATDNDNEWSEELSSDTLFDPLLEAKDQSLDGTGVAALAVLLLLGASLLVMNKFKLTPKK